MKYFCYLLVLLTFFVTSCKTNSAEEDLTPEQLRVRDSISKAKQREHADSLKKTNPLLIVPPDSNYTGSYIDKYPSGVIKFRGFFRQGKRHGQWMSFYPNGFQWSEMNYDKGLRNGPNMTFNIDGKPNYTGFYKNDKKDSVWCFYDSTGRPLRKVLYSRNRLVKDLPMN